MANKNTEGRLTKDVYPVCKTDRKIAGKGNNISNVVIVVTGLTEMVWRSSLHCNSDCNFLND